MSRPYTGWDKNATGKRAGMEKLVQLLCFASGNTLWNNGTWNVRNMNNPGKARPSVHGTGRAADLSWRRQADRNRGGTYQDAVRMADFIVQWADLLRIEEIHDYYPAPFGRGWRCDRAAWRVYDKQTIGSAPGGDWLHIEISNEFADDPGYYDRVFKDIFAGTAKASAPAPGPAKVTSTKLSSVEASKPAGPLVFTYPGKPIKIRSRDTAAVKLIQAALKVTIDGKFGPQTETAVKQFQSSKGLQPTGEVGPDTWNALFPA
jgi:hypothetical protein